MKVMVTGAQGFIGRYLSAALVTQGHDVIGVGRSPQIPGFTHQVTWNARSVPAPLTPPLAAALEQPNYRYATLDLSDADGVKRVLAKESFDLIYHLAGALRDSSIDLLVRSNILASHAVFEGAAASTSRPRIVFASSGSVIGPVPPEQLPIPEHRAMPLQPVDPYAITKRAAEEFALLARRLHGLEIVTARVFAVIGPGQEERHLCGHLARQFAERHSGIFSAEIQVGPLDTTRDFVDVRDVAAALLLLGTTDAPPDLCNVASGRETPTAAIFSTLKSITDEPADYLPRKAARVMELGRSVADIAQIRELGFTPQFDLQQSLSDLLAWYATDVAAARQAMP